MKRDASHRPAAPDELRGHGLHVATRLVATLRMGRAYAIDNPVFTGQVEQLIEALQPVFATGAEVRLTTTDGDLLLNGVAFSQRASASRFAVQVAHELRVRMLEGLEFRAGLTAPELTRFMRCFLPSELYKGHDLARACNTHGVLNAIPLLRAGVETAAAAPARPAPADYAEALTTCTHALHDAWWLLGSGRPHGIASHRYQRVVAPVVDAVLAGRPLSAGMADLDDTGGGGWVRGVHTCLLAVMVGAALGLERGPLAVLGAAALLHGADDGDDEGTGDPVARALLRRARLAPLDPAVLAAMRTVLPGSGDAGERTDTCPLANILRIADAYVVLATRHTARGPRRTPQQALGMLLGPLAPQFHPALRAALVRALGLHPPGQIVELDDGSVARVLAADVRDPGRPLVERITGPGATRLDPAERDEVIALPEGRRIVRAVPFTGPGEARGNASAA